MAAGNLRLEVATPERLLVQEDTTEVSIPAANGMIGILPEHAPLLRF
jgi:F0F1-type ATP synthase epsilon subunit